MMASHSRCLVSRSPAWETGARRLDCFQQTSNGPERRLAGPFASEHARGFFVSGSKMSGDPVGGCRQFGNLVGARGGVLKKGPGAGWSAIAQTIVRAEARDGISQHGTSQHEPASDVEKGREGPPSTVLHVDDEAASPSECKKQCAKCKHVKLDVDFEIWSTTRDGRHLWCRACLATHRAMQRGDCPDHLRLSVEEAWEQRKACCTCKHVKELRDFCRSASRKDGLKPYCRACQSKEKWQRVERAPSSIPQVCTTCNTLKAASEFDKDKRRLSGLKSTCKKCFRVYYNNWKVKRKASAQIPTSEKRCCKCSVVKQATEFYEHQQSPDGRHTWCKSCTSVAKARQYQEKKMKAEGVEA